MSAQGLEVIDHTVQLTHEWINELAQRLDWTSARDTLRLLRSTMQALRDHLPDTESAQLSAQLPLMIRGMYFEGWVPDRTPLRERTLAAFQARIEAKLGDVRDYRGVEDIGTVFKLFNSRISRGEVEDVRASLPNDIRKIWPAP